MKTNRTARMIQDNKYNIVFVIIIGLILSFFCFSEKLSMGHDTYFHMYRLQGILNALQDGQLFPRIYPYANNGFGYATPLFYCEIFFVPFAILYRVGVPIVICYKIMKSLFLFLSVITIFYSSSKIFKNNKDAPYIATILYSFCNYHLYDIYVRDSFGENLAFVFIPLVILSSYYVFVEKKDKWILLGTSFSLLLFSHVISFAMFCVVFFLFSVVFFIDNRNNSALIKNTLLTIVKAVMLALLMSAFYLLPMLEQFTSQSFNVQYYGNLYNIKDTAKIIEMLFRPFVSIKNYYSQGNSKADVFNLGLVFISFQMLYFYVLYKKRIKKTVTLLFIVSILFVLLSLGLLPNTGLLSFVNTVQFAFRFNIVAFPLMTFVITYCMVNVDNKMRNTLLFVLIVYSLINVGLIVYEEPTNDFYFHDYDSIEIIYDDPTSGEPYAIKEISLGEYLPANDVYQYYWPDAKTIKIINDDRKTYYDACEEIDGTYYPIEYKKTGTKIEFNYSSKENNIIMLPLTYYKGYEIYAYDDNDLQYRLAYEDIGKYKQVAFKTLIGDYKYVCHYEQTIIQEISLIVSLITSILTLGYVLHSRKKVLEGNNESR